MIKIFTKQFINNNKNTPTLFLNKNYINTNNNNSYKKNQIKTINSTTSNINKMKFNYPETRRDETICDTFKSKLNGEVKVYDPYRHLEDQNSEETKKWVDEENKITREFLDGDGLDTSEKITKELMKKLDYERFGWFRRRGSKLFFSKNPNTLNQDIVYLIDIDQVKMSDDINSSATGFENAIEFLNPNTISKDGTWSLKSFVISKSGDHVVYSYSKAGSDWEEIAVKKVITTNEKDNTASKYAVVDLPDHINWCKFTSIKWNQDETGFVYNRYPKPSTVKDEEKGTETDSNFNNSVYYHKLGDLNESNDILILECPPDHPEWIFSPYFSDDFNTLFISIHRDCNPEHNLYLVRNFKSSVQQKQEPIKIEKLIDNFDACYYYICNRDNQYYFLSNLLAPMNRLISIDIDSSKPIPNQSELVIKEIIPEKKDAVLENIGMSSENKLYASYQKDVIDIVQVYDMEGKYLKDIKLPGAGTASVSVGSFHEHIYITFSSIVSPSTIYYLNSKDDKLVLLKEPHIEGFKSSDYICKQVFYESPKDKTSIPMFIAYRKDTDVTSGSAPTYMTGYGGFNITYSPTFSLRNIYFLDKFKGIFVIANIRGGGERGLAWHNAGRRHNKQNCFDDFIGAAEYLIREKYTRDDKLAIRGGSNGGLLMGAVSNQRPDLFKCVVADVGVMDMLRYHHHTIALNWSSDYGLSNEETGADFDTLIKYSPLNNVPKNATQYPSIMLCTGDHDDRVIPAHSYKFIAELQYQLGKKVETPLLIRVDKDSGHGAGKSLTKQNQEIADIFNFFSKVLKCNLNF